jgi:uncharacterized hydrophobic protein (TIGR00271 family)
MNIQNINYSNLRAYFSTLLSLKEDKADDADIDKGLRNGINMRGSNLWVLMFAILIAAIGLNVNSTAVVIGAMLISPLMGPIMGVGYGVGIYDFELIRASLKNLAIAAVASLLTSTLYFAISPLTQAQSELLARTTPTIWDVLIALFGGLAGIVGATRIEKTNVIPGVAIATALMPPLCTAGYGIANGNWAYFGGAFYLFTINCVFIALSSAVITRIYHVKKKQFVDEETATRVKRYVFSVALLTIVPSIYLAYVLVQNEVFKTNAATFVQKEIVTEQTYVTQSNIEPKTKTIEITVIGEYLSKTKLAAISARLADAGLEQAKLIVHQQADQQRIDVTTLKTGLLNDLYLTSQQSIEQKDKVIQQLSAELGNQKRLQKQMQQVPHELHVLYPQITEIWFSQATNWSQENGMSDHVITLLNVSTSKPLTKQDQARIKEWIVARMNITAIKLVVENHK